MSDIRVFTELRDETLSSAWKWLYKASGRCPQNDYNWNAAWWRHFGGSGRTPLILTLWRGPECTALAPFMVERSKGFSRMRFLGVGLTDYHDVLCLPGEDPGTVVALFLAHVKEEHPVDLMQMEQVSERSSMAGSLMGFPGASCRRCAECPGVEFADKSWEEYLRGLRSEVRKRWRKKLRRLEASGELRFVVKDDPAGKQSLLQMIFDLHVKRWSAVGVESKFQIPQVQDFIKDILATMDESSIHALTLDGAVIAYRMGFEGPGVYFDWNQSFDPRFSKESAGFVLMGMSLRHCCERGVKTFDFMRGNYQYKRAWLSGEPVPANWEFFLPLTWPRGSLAAAYYSDWKWRIKKAAFPLLGMRSVQRLRQRKALGLN